MYIKKLFDKNVGPIKDALIEFPFNSNGTPKPVIIVGENGSGKSTLLSNIVDAFYEIAGEAFSDARQPNDREGYQYYKAISNSEIHLGEDFLCSYIAFEDKQCSPPTIDYIFKSGDITFDTFKGNSRFPIKNDLSWGTKANHKIVIVSKTNAEKLFSNNVLCYFGPERYEKPNWLGNKYYNLSDFEHPSVKPRWTGEIGTPIEVKNMTPATLQWLLDVIVDSRCDISKNGDSLSIAHINADVLLALGKARTNIEIIMSKILNKDVYFSLNNRSAHGSRFCIKSKADDSILAPTLDALSTGQSALFNLFATIVRYADAKNINNSLNLKDITGIVVIDEIELHLHSNLQRDVLPELISLFPKVQFVISTHSPLFLLGMDKHFENDGYEIYQMPDAQVISSERFSEFQKAYAYFEESKFHEEKIRKAIFAQQNKTLVITEGATDWKHMKAAYQQLCVDPTYSEWLSKLEFEFLEYEPENSTEDVPIKLKMSASQLQTLCKQHRLVPQSRKIIFIADRDVPDVTKELDQNGAPFKNWGNNVFSFCLPIPPHRSETPKICIEHYYTDSEIRTPVDLGDGVLRRIFLGNEFDSDGFSISAEDYFCKDKNACGENSIAIIDGSDLKKVIHPREKPPVNYTLSKMMFAKKILLQEEPFNNLDFSSFVPLFENIRDIISL